MQTNWQKLGAQSVSKKVCGQSTQSVVSGLRRIASMVSIASTVPSRLHPEASTFSSSSKLGARNRVHAFGITAVIATTIPWSGGDAKASPLTRSWCRVMTEGEHSMTQGKFGAARRNFQTAAKISEEDKFLHTIALRRLADSMSGLGEFDAAARIYVKQLGSRDKQDPGTIPYLMGAANCAEARGNYKQARQYLEQAKLICSDPSALTDVRPDCADVMLGLISVHLKQRNPDQLNVASTQLKYWLSKIAARHRRLFRTTTVCTQLNQMLLTAPPATFAQGIAVVRALRLDLLGTANNGEGAGDACTEAWSLRYQLINELRQTNPRDFAVQLHALIKEMASHGIDPTDDLLSLLIFHEAELHMSVHSKNWWNSVDRAATLYVQNNGRKIETIALLSKSLHRLKEEGRQADINRVLQRIRALIPADATAEELTLCGDNCCVSSVPESLDLAVELYTRSIEAGPTIDAFLHRSNALSDQRKFLPALQDSDKAFQLCHLRTIAPGGLAGMLERRAIILCELQRFAQAESACKQSLSKEETRLRHCTLAYIYAKAGLSEKEQAEYRAAIALGAKQLESAPHDIVLRKDQARLLRLLKEDEKALEQYDECCKLAPKDASNFVTRGNFLWAINKNSKQAISDLRHALQMGSRDPIGLTTLGHCLVGSDVNAARSYYYQALKLAPREFNAYWGLGCTFNAEGKFGEAIKCYDRAIEIMPVSGLYVDRAECKKKIGDIAGAMADTRQALMLSPNDKQVRARCKAIESH